MDDSRKKTAAMFEEKGFSKTMARALVMFGDLPIPLTEDTKKNLDLLLKHINPSALQDDECMKVAFFLKRSREQVRFMAEVPEKYDFSPEEEKTYYAGILGWGLSCDLREEIGDVFAELLPDEAQREHIYRRMYLCGAWWHGEYLREILNALRRIAVDKARMADFIAACYQPLFSFYGDTAECIARLEEVFLPEHIQEVLESEPFLPAKFTPHFDPENDPEAAIEALVEQFPDYVKK
ncbi:MAG: hypothetical protein IKM02_07520 [Clostridia bacterium]|nr:hypothetical protein [Clostridia bacterium]